MSAGSEKGAFPLVVLDHFNLLSLGFCSVSMMCFLIADLHILSPTPSAYPNQLVKTPEDFMLLFFLLDKLYSGGMNSTV